MVQGQHTGVQRKAEADAGAGAEHGSEEHGNEEVSQPNEPAEQEADAKADEVADDLHSDDKKKDKKGGDKKPDAKTDKPISAKLEGVGRKVWAKLRFDAGVSFLDGRNPKVAAKFAGLAAVSSRADALSGGLDVEVQAGAPKQGKAAFQFGGGTPAITIAPMPQTPNAKQEMNSLDGDDVASRASELSHEMQHCADAFDKADPSLMAAMRGKKDMDAEIHGEWKAFAQQAKTAADVAKTGKAPPSPHRELLKAWKQNTFDKSTANVPQSMFSNTTAYMYKCTGKPPSVADVDKFINAHQSWVAEAFQIFQPYQGRVP